MSAPPESAPPAGAPFAGAPPAKPGRRLLLALLGAPLVLGLGACGRKGPLRPPEGRESEYTYPRRYPAPETVLPSAGEESEAAEETDAESGGS